MATTMLLPIDAPAPLSCRCTSCDDALAYPVPADRALCQACKNPPAHTCSCCGTSVATAGFCTGCMTRHIQAEQQAQAAQASDQAATPTATVTTYTAATATRRQQECAGEVAVLVEEFDYIGKVAEVTTTGDGFDVRLWVDYGKIRTPMGKHYARKQSAIKYAQQLLQWAYEVYAHWNTQTEQMELYVDGVFRETVDPKFVADRMTWLRRFGRQQPPQQVAA